MDNTTYLRFYFDNGFITDIEYATYKIDKVMQFTIGTGNSIRIIGVQKLINYDKRLGYNMINL